MNTKNEENTEPSEYSQSWWIGSWVFSPVTITFILFQIDGYISASSAFSPSAQELAHNILISLTFVILLLIGLIFLLDSSPKNRKTIRDGFWFLMPNGHSRLNDAMLILGILSTIGFPIALFTAVAAGY